MSNLAVRSFYAKVLRFRAAYTALSDLANRPSMRSSKKLQEARSVLESAKTELLLDLAIDSERGTKPDLVGGDVLLHLSIQQHQSDCFELLASQVIPVVVTGTEQEPSMAYQLPTTGDFAFPANDAKSFYDLVSSIAQQLR